MRTRCFIIWANLNRSSSHFFWFRTVLCIGKVGRKTSNSKLGLQAPVLMQTLRQVIKIVCLPNTECCDRIPHVSRDFCWHYHEGPVWLHPNLWRFPCVFQFLREINCNCITNSKLLQVVIRPSETRRTKYRVCAPTALRIEIRCGYIYILLLTFVRKHVSSSLIYETFDCTSFITPKTRRTDINFCFSGSIDISIGSWNVPLLYSAHIADNPDTLRSSCHNLHNEHSK